MASPPELQSYEALVQQKSERWDSERLWELYYDRDSKAVNTEECLKIFLSENQLLFCEANVDFCQLVIELNRCGLLSNSDKDRYTSALAAYGMPMRFNHFTQTLKDSTKIPRCDVVSDLYLALRNTYEENTGGKSYNHYYLAKSLRTIVLKLLNFREIERNTAAMIGMMKCDKYNVQKGVRLMSELGITVDSPETLDYKTICQLWLKDHKKQHSLDILVCALIRSGLGKLSTFLQPHCKSNPPEVMKLLRQLPKTEESWIDLAHFLGYADDDPEIVAVRSVDAPAVRLQMFLRFCRIPDCGDATQNVVMCLRQSPLFGGPSTQVFFREEPDIPQGQPSVPPTLRPQVSSKQTAVKVLEQPTKPTAVQQYKFTQDDGVRFLDNCIFDYWKDVDSLLELSTTKLPPEVTDQDGKTAFLIACTKGRVDIQRIRKMVTRGPNLLQMDNSGYTVLHYKSVLCNRELLEFLLISFRERQLSIDIPTRDNRFTPLMMACMLGNDAWQSVELLLKYGASPDGNPETFSSPLMEATQGGSTRLVESLIRFRANLNHQDNDGNTALLKACRSQRWNIAKMLINSPNISINICDNSGNTPLFVCVSENCYEIAELLLRKGADLNGMRISSHEMMTGFVEETPLAHACARGFLTIVKLLISYGADVNFKCSDRVPAIGFAIILKQNFIVRYLLDNCIELDTSIYGLMAPISISVSVQNFECTNMMVDKLGGLDRCIQLASSNGLMELDQQLRTYAAFMEPSFGENPAQPRLNTINPAPKPRLDEDKQKDQILLQEFCEICMNAIEDKSKHKSGVSFEDLASIAEAMATPRITNFIWRCASKTQEVQELTDDFLTTEEDVSALSFLITSGALTHDDFKKYSLLYFRISNEDEIQIFYNALVIAFRNISGNENLPHDTNQVLEGLFSRRYVLKYKSTTSTGEHVQQIQGATAFPGLGNRLGHKSPPSDYAQSPVERQSTDEEYSDRLTDSKLPVTKPPIKLPKFIKHPQDKCVLHNGEIALEVMASGSELKYLWMKDGAELTKENNPNCSGIQTSCLKIEGFNAQNVGKYSCVVSNSGNSIESWDAKLTLGGNILSSLELSALRRYLSDKVAVAYLNNILEHEKQRKTLQDVQLSLRQKGLLMYADELEKNLELEVENYSEELLTKAMEEGCVECMSGILLLVGVAGAGKSSFKRVLFEEDNEILRHSTPLAEAAVRAVSTTVATVTDISWKRYTLEELLANSTLDLDLPQTSSQKPGSASPRTRQPPHSNEGELSLSQSVTNQENNSSTLSTCQDEVVLQQKDIPVPVGTEVPETQRRLIHGNLHMKETLKKICEQIRRISSESGVNISTRTWIYVIDSGGQPQFQEMLPIFIKNASAVAFFVKLNEKLDDHPSVEYYVKGRAQGIPYPSSLNHEEIIKNSLHTIQSRQGASGEQECPKLLFVGTFRDKLSDSTEDVDSKNTKIKDLINHNECCRDSLISYRDNEPLFQVNAKHPNRFDHEVVNRFKQGVTKAFNSSKPFPVPIKWFLFEQLLQDVSAVNKTSVFSMKECEDIASWLYMDTNTLHVALAYLSRHNIISWFKDILSDVIFTSAQVILDKLSELVERSYILCNNSDPDLTSSEESLFCILGIWSDFRTYGYVTVDILNEFPKHYNEIFTPTKLLIIWEKLLIVGRESSGRYFMPCILRTLRTEELCKYRTESEDESCPLPLLFFYDKQFFPTGVFSCLISYLHNESGWNILKFNNQPKCFYKNCVQFSHKKVKITLIYSQKFIEVHPKWMMDKSCAERQSDCLRIAESIKEGLCKAAEAQNYVHLLPKAGIFCPAEHKTSLSSHVAVRDEDNCWECTVDGEMCGKLFERHLWWFTRASAGHTDNVASSASITPLRCPPKIEELLILKIKNGSDIRIMEKVAPVWKKTAITLGFDEAKISTIEIGSHYKPEDATLEMFSLWLKGAQNLKPATWSTLITCLKDVKLNELANLLNNLKTKGDETSIQLSTVPSCTPKHSDEDENLASSLTPVHQSSLGDAAQFIPSRSISIDTQTSEERSFDKSISHDSGVDSIKSSVGNIKVSPILKQPSDDSETETQKGSLLLTSEETDSHADSLIPKRQVSFSASAQFLPSRSDSVASEQQQLHRDNSKESGFDSITSCTASLQSLETVISEKYAQQSKPSPENQPKDIQGDSETETQEGSRFLTSEETYCHDSQLSEGEVSVCASAKSVDTKIPIGQVSVGASAQFQQSRSVNVATERQFHRDISKESGFDSLTSSTGSLRSLESVKSEKVAQHFKPSPEKQLKDIQNKSSMESITRSNVRSITKSLTDKLGKYDCSNEPPHGSTQSAPTDSHSTDTCDRHA